MSSTLKPVAIPGGHLSQVPEIDTQGNPAAELTITPVGAKTFSLTRRLVITVVACQLLLTLGLAFVSVLYARTQLHDSFNTALDGDAISTLALLRYTEIKPHVLKFHPYYLPPSPDPNHPALFEFRGADGRLIVRSPGWNGVPSEVEQSSQKYTDFTFGGSSYRAVIFHDIPVLDSEEDIGPEKVTEYYASSLADNRLLLERLAFYVGLTSLLLMLAANSFAVWSIRRGLDPLRELADQAGAISVQNWNFRPSSGAKLANELSPLVRAIETVLCQLKKAFRQQRDFTSDAAHESKTSVAIVKSGLQLLLHRPRTQREYEIGLEELLDDCARLENLLERMLHLARIEQLHENGARARTTSVDLASTCEAALSRIHTLGDERNVSLTFEVTASVFLLADSADLELIWMNLLENAVQNSPPNSTVAMRLRQDSNGMAQVSVLDSGPGIPPAELPHIFERFRRGETAPARSTSGFGLGLAICKALVDAYGGTIEAANLPERGAEIRVNLPISRS